MTRNADDIIKEAELDLARQANQTLEKKAEEAGNVIIQNRGKVDLEKLASESPLIKLAMEKDFFLNTKSFRFDNCIEKVAAGATGAAMGFLQKMLTSEAGKRIAIGAGAGAGAGLLAGNKDDRMGSALKGALLGAAGGAAYHGIKSFGAPDVAGKTLGMLRSSEQDVAGRMKSMVPTSKSGVATKVRQARAAVAEPVLQKNLHLAGIKADEAGILGANKAADRIGVVSQHLQDTMNAGKLQFGEKAQSLTNAREALQSTVNDVRGHLNKANITDSARLEATRSLDAAGKAGTVRWYNPRTYLAKNRARELQGHLENVRGSLTHGYTSEAEAAGEAARKAIGNVEKGVAAPVKMKATGTRTITPTSTFATQYHGLGKGKIHSFKPLPSAAPAPVAPVNAAERMNRMGLISPNYIGGNKAIGIVPKTSFTSGFVDGLGSHAQSHLM